MDTGQDRVTVQVAAQRLGVSEQAIRKRVKRGTLDSEKEEDGRVYVYLDAGQDEDRDDVPPHDSTSLISSYEARIEDLRQALDAEREANRENRRIIAALTSRIPAIEAGDPPGETEPPAEGESTPDQGETEREDSRPWWRRIFD